MRTTLHALALIFVLAPAAHARGKSRPKPHATATPAPEIDSAEIRGGHEIIVHDSLGKARKTMSSNAHEGLANLTLSPDRRWATAVATYPYDVIGADKIETYPIVIHLASGTRLDLEDFPKHFGLDHCLVKDFALDKTRSATVKVTCADGTTPLVDLPAPGAPPIPTAE